MVKFESASIIGTFCQIWVVSFQCNRLMNTCSWSDLLFAFSEDPSMSGLAVDLVFTLSGFTFLAFEFASFGQMWVFVIWISGLALPQFWLIHGIGQFMTVAFTWSLNEKKIKRARSSIEWLSMIKVRFFSRAQNIRSKSMKLPCRQQRHHYPCLAFLDQGIRNQSRLRRQQQVRKYRIISFFRILIFQFWIGIFKRTCGACYLLTSQQSMNNLNNLERDQVVDSKSSKWLIKMTIKFIIIKPILYITIYYQASLPRSTIQSMSFGRSELMAWWTYWFKYQRQK